MTSRRPGLGRGLIFITGLLMIAALTAFLFVGPIAMLAWVSDPDVLLYLVFGNIVYLLMRLVAGGFAYVSAPGARHWFLSLAVAVIVTIPHVALGWAGWETRQALLTVFSEQSPSLVATPVTTTLSSTTTTTIVPVNLSPIVTIPGQGDSATASLSRTDGWRPFGTERLNILLLGGDAGPGRSGLRTDTLMVASIDPVSGDAALISVPRNFGAVRLTDGSPVPVSQIGHVYGWGADQPELFEGPDAGAAATVEAVAYVTGLEIDHFVLVDLTGFADVVDAFGGVELEVAEPVDGPLYDVVTGGYEMVHISAGTQRLDGDHALAYARARYGSSDYARMGRQRCILATMAAQADVVSLFSRLGKLLNAVEANLVTDIPMDMIPDLIRLTPRVSSRDIRMIGFDATWGAGFTAAGSTIPDLDRIREAVKLTIRKPGKADLIGATTATAGC